MMGTLRAQMADQESDCMYVCVCVICVCGYLSIMRSDIACLPQVPPLNPLMDYSTLGSELGVSAMVVK